MVLTLNETVNALGAHSLTKGLSNLGTCLIVMERSLADCILCSGCE